MSVGKELLRMFPLDLLIFVISSGLLFTSFFPFDIMSLEFTDGLQTPTLNDIQELPVSIERNLKPFVMLRYFADFPNGLVKIFLLSLIPGLLIFFLQRQVEWINGKIMRGKVRKKLNIPFSCEGADRTKKTSESLKFSQWLDKNNVSKFIGFFWSLHYVPIGMMYSLEFLLGIFLLSAGIASLSGNISWSLLFWSAVFFVLLVCAYAVYLASERLVKTYYDNFYNTFKSERKQD